MDTYWDAVYFYWFISMIPAETRALWRKHALERLERKDPMRVQSNGNNQIIIQLLDALDHQDADLHRLQEAILKRWEQDAHNPGTGTYCLFCRALDEGGNIHHDSSCLVISCQAALGTEAGK